MGPQGAGERRPLGGAEGALRRARTSAKSPDEREALQALALLLLSARRCRRRPLSSPPPRLIGASIVTSARAVAGDRAGRAPVPGLGYVRAGYKRLRAATCGGARAGRIRLQRRRTLTRSRSGFGAADDAASATDAGRRRCGPGCGPGAAGPGGGGVAGADDAEKRLGRALAAGRG